jgi:hypothetical protein
MRPETWLQIEEFFAELPGAKAEGVPENEINAAEAQLGIRFPADYKQFLLRYGGAQLKASGVAGLRPWQFASRDNWSVVGVTQSFRKQEYPGSERWIIFSDDGFGNPIGLDSAGRVWISDHNSCEFVCLESSFEDWICRHALKTESLSGSYVHQEKWPEEILNKLRKPKLANE